MQPKEPMPLAEVFKILARRTLKGNFQRERAMDSEREVMATARKPITDPLAQDYVAWRRGVLWLATVTMSIHALVSFFAWLDDIKVDVDGAQLTAMGLDGVGGILKFVGSALYRRIQIGRAHV